MDNAKTPLNEVEEKTAFVARNLVKSAFEFAEENMKQNPNDTLEDSMNIFIFEKLAVLAVTLDHIVNVVNNLKK